MAVIKVPRTPKTSFNPHRRPSALLLDQVKHLEWAALPASQRKPRQLKKYGTVKTEAQAAERIAQLTAMVLLAKEQAAKEPAPDGPPAKVVLPPLPQRRRRKAKVSRNRRSQRSTKRKPSVRRKRR